MPLIFPKGASAALTGPSAETPPFASDLVFHRRVHSQIPPAVGISGFRRSVIVALRVEISQPSPVGFESTDADKLMTTTAVTRYHYSQPTRESLDWAVCRLLVVWDLRTGDLRMFLGMSHVERKVSCPAPSVACSRPTTLTIISPLRSPPDRTLTSAVNCCLILPGQRRAPSDIGAFVPGPGSESPLSDLGIAVLPAMAASHHDKVTTMRHPRLQRPPDHQWNSGGRSNSDVCLSNTTAPLLARHFFSWIPAIHLRLDSTRRRGPILV